jgi:hypothetical protein
LVTRSVRHFQLHRLASASNGRKWRVVAYSSARVGAGGGESQRNRPGVIAQFQAGNNLSMAAIEASATRRIEARIHSAAERRWQPAYSSCELLGVPRRW